MAEIKLSPGKKRYSVSLTQDKVEKFQSLCRDLRIHPRVMSEICDDAIDNMTAYFQTVKREGFKGYSQIMKVAGQQMELLEEKAKEVKVNEKTDSNLL